MTRTLDVRRSLAATAALVVATVGATALSAAADPGNGNGQGNSHGQSQSHKNDDKKNDKGDKDKGDKGPKGPKSGNGNIGGNGGGNGHGNSGGGNGHGNSGGNGGGNGDPAGNNGTVKITPIGQDDGIPQNNPHVPCGFDIEWYGFDEGDDIISTVTLAMHAPTKDVVLTPGGPSSVFVGGDPATGAGTETGFDGEATYYPTFDGEPHPQQGYHIKLTVHTPGSQGADTKHKVFWVEPCETPTEESPGEEEVEEPCVEGDMTEECDDTVVEGEEETDEQDSSSTDAGTTDETEVLGEQASAAPVPAVKGAQANADAAAGNVPNAVDAGGEGNPVLDFVRSPLPLLIIGLGALLAGFAFVSRRRNSNI